MQGLADGYFVIPYTIADYLANDIRTGTISTELPEFDEAEQNVKDRISAFINNDGNTPVDVFHKRLGQIIWNKVGMARNVDDLQSAIEEISTLREEFYKDVYVPGSADGMNPELEKAGRVADLIELGQLMARDALERNESCGGHFREDSVEIGGPQAGEAKRNDEEFMYVAAWEYNGPDAKKSTLHKEELEFNNIEVKQRSYK